MSVLKVRRELNTLLYEKKIDEQLVTGRISDYSMYRSVCNGNIDVVKKELVQGVLSFDADERIFSKDRNQNKKYHFMLAASTLADACVACGMGKSEAYAIADIYILKADECRKMEVLTNLFADMCMDYTERVQEIRKEKVISLHVRKCIQYIYENLGVDLSIKALAQIIDLNPTYLSRLFKQEVGISLKQFVKEAKIDTAQNLLRYSEISYLLIATSLGYSSQSKFISAFKDVVGVTPKVFRERYYLP